MPIAGVSDPPKQVGNLKVRHDGPLGRTDLVADARVADVVDVVARDVPIRSVLSVAGDRTVDDARVDGAHRCIADAESIHDTRPELLDDRVGVAREPHEHFASLVGL